MVIRHHNQVFTNQRMLNQGKSTRFARSYKVTIVGEDKGEGRHRGSLHSLCCRGRSCSSRTSRSPLHSYLSHILYNKLCLWWSSPGQWCLLLWSENFKTWGAFYWDTLWIILINYGQKNLFAESFDKSFWLWAYSHCSVWSMFCSQGSRHTWQSAPVRHCNILDKVLKRLL